jgi:hypothetical protein
MRYRFARPSDFKTLQTLIAPGFQASPRVHGSLLELWQTLSADGRIRMTVVEDQEQPPEQAIQVITASGFANEDFVQKYLANPHPGLAAEVYERVLGGQSPLLSQREIRAANSDQGLHLIMLHFALRNPDLQDASVQQLMVAVNAAFFFFYGGYRLTSAMQEVYGRQAAEYMEAGGFHIVSDFSDGRASKQRDTDPYLLLLRKDQVQPSVVNPLSFLFYPVPPRIHFSVAEQKLLELALLNESDLEISEGLGVSLDAVKKTWRRAYQRAARSAPHLLGSGEEIDGNSRGVEKRRHLLEYVRIHPEELRAHNP